MAISVNPATFVIFVPQADMTLIQSAPEVRELNLNDFRLELKDWEDDGDGGITFLKTHTHNTEVALAGLTYARTIEILAPYTVEFEDAQYSVNCVGANHNLSDVRVSNQVSLIINNAAGLINNPAIEFSSFGGGVSIDETSDVTGTTYPRGTPQLPVNNWADALLIRSFRGLPAIFVIGDGAVPASADISGLVIQGESKTKSTVTVSAAATVVGAEFENCTVTGTLDGGSKLTDCNILTLNFVDGVAEDCLIQGPITLSGAAPARFINCESGVAGTNTPIIDMGGSGSSLEMRRYTGGIELTNKTGPDAVSIDLLSGQVKTGATVGGSGTIVLRGVGKWVDTGATADVLNEMFYRSRECRVSAIYDSGTLLFDAWVARGGESATDATDCQIAFYESGVGSALFTTALNSTPDARGHFQFSVAQALTSNTPYYASVVINDPDGEVTTEIPLPLVGP